MKKKEKILFATDHAGFLLKEKLVLFVREMGYDVEDLGAHECNEEDDYPDFISLVARRVSKDPEGVRGIVLGGSGQGEAIVANRFPHVRAVVFNGQYNPLGRVVPNEIVTSREHNDANILSLGARFVAEWEAKIAVKDWLETDFTMDERHVRRIKKIEEYPK